MTMEIKFRAWEKSFKKMRYFGQMEYCSEYNLLAWALDKESEEPSGGTYCNLETMDVKGFEVMQYTGLKDKSGKEIYEGDILATSNNNPEYDLWAKEDNGYTTVVWDEHLDGWTGSKWAWEKDNESVCGLEFVEVIGNVWENAELIEAKEK